MVADKRNALAIAIVLLFGVVLFYLGTDGFRAYTTESARTYELKHGKPEIPDVTLQDAQGRTFKWSEFANGKYVFLSFMYTSCVTVCPQIEMNMSKVYQLIPADRIGKDIVFLSISFDPERDDPQVLEQYGGHFGVDGDTWRMARVKDQAELKLLLNKLGVVAVPDGNGNFTHTTSFYLADRTGHVQDVIDFTKVKGAADRILKHLNGGKGGAPS